MFMFGWPLLINCTSTLNPEAKVPTTAFIFQPIF
jgi:hypothetical protein